MELGRINQKGTAKELLLKIDKFDGGTNTMVDEARLGNKFAKESTNLIQVQDGLWKTRWGFNYYGEAIPGEDSLDGAAEYVKSDGSRELIAVGGTTGKVYKSADDGKNWSQILGATFTPGTPVNFIQIEGLFYLTNGVDLMARYNGTSLAAYAQISAPTNVALSRGGGLTEGSYHAYYQITAVTEVGETNGSTETSITINKERNTWVGASDEYIDITWDAVAGAKRYNIYYDDEAGYEVYLGSTTANSFKDDNTLTPIEQVEVPDDNTTGAPKFATTELSGNRLWGTKDPDNPYRVYCSGGGQFMGSFSPFYGGLWVDLEKGGRETPIKVVHYRTGKGDPIATVLCSSPEGLGSIWQIDVSTITVGDTTITIPIPYKVVGSIGSNAPAGIVKARENIIFPNRRGIFGLRNREQLFNVLATDEFSQAIRPNYRSLNNIENICGYYYDGKIFFSGAEGSANDIIFILDLERNNWQWKWTRGVKGFLEYTDSGDRTHLLAIPPTGGRLWEISERFSGDFGQGFYQAYISPLISVSKDKTDIFKLTEALVELGRARGTVNFEVLGISKNKGFSSIATATITNFGSNAGIGTDLLSAVLLSDTSLIPTVFTTATTKKAIRKRKKLYAIQFRVSSTKADTDFTILSIQAKGRLLKQRTPSMWLN